LDISESNRFTPHEAPPLLRGAMVPTPWLGALESIRGLLSRASRPAVAVHVDAGASRRRRLFAALVIGTGLLAGVLMQLALGGRASPLMNAAQVGLFSLLFAWLAGGFFTAAMGFVVLLRGDARGMRWRDLAGRPIADAARTAIIMPICNENVATVHAGLRATWASLEAGGQARHFDLFILSDTADAGLRAAERQAWLDLRAQFPGAGIHYRWRRVRRHRKAGNVADFCRRWGRLYRYMVVLDADSVMDGDCLATLVRLMEAHPGAGIIQTSPRAFGLDTFHARAQQFAGRVCGSLFAAGMQFWQLGESHYWGHNAILRVEPFMRHCALARIPGRGPLAGDILSHDFVEAALMRRAGYRVCLVPDLGGSYEQQPPDLLAELQRDRRWCQGNLRNAALIAQPGLHPVHRAMLAVGAMAYLSAPLWLAYVLLGTWRWVREGLAPGGATLPWQLGLLWAGMVGMLLAPRLLGVLAILLRRDPHGYGGTAALLASAVVEALVSLLQAPIRMVAHTLYVLGAVTGLRLEWKSPPREAAALGWSEAARRFLPVMAATAALLAATHARDPNAVAWLLPIALPLLLCVPIAVLTSRSGAGRWMRRHGLLLTPEEVVPPPVLRLAGFLSRRRGT
jgi:membrane glycosyltransferase